MAAEAIAIEKIKRATAEDLVSHVGVADGDVVCVGRIRGRRQSASPVRPCRPARRNKPSVPTGPNCPTVPAFRDGSYVAARGPFGKVTAPGPEG